MAAPSLYRYKSGKVFRARELPLYLGRAWHDTTEQPHDHDFMEIVLVLRGSAEHESIAGRHRLTAGDVVILRPGVWHAYRFARRLEIYNCCFGAELLHRELGWLLDDPAMNYLFWSGPLSPNRHGIILSNIGRDSLNRCLKLLDVLAAEGMSAGHRPRQIGLLLQFLDELATNLQDRSDDVNRKPATEVSLLARRALRLMEEDIAHPWLTRDLAAHLAVNESHLVRRVKAATGLPPLAYLARLRAERAANLLIRSKMPVADIGTTVGWDEPYYFARRFKAHFGLSATEYRRRFARTILQ